MLLSAGGCENGTGVRVSRTPPAPVEEIDQIVLRLTPPTPVNWDDDPAADGLQVQVHFFQVDRPLSVTVKGSLEFVLYAGRLTASQAAEAQPWQIWTLNRVSLAGHAGRSLVGWGYAIPLSWQPRKPRMPVATLIARYHSPSGRQSVSRPIFVAMGDG